MTALRDSQVNDMVKERKKYAWKKAEDKHQRDEEPNVNHKEQETNTPNAAQQYVCQ